MVEIIEETSEETPWIHYRKSGGDLKYSPLRFYNKDDSWKHSFPGKKIINWVEKIVTVQNRKNTYLINFSSKFIEDIYQFKNQKTL
jgi:hypothetical protein